jgi:hypothetical protein
MTMLVRPGAALLARYLELKYFHPSTKDNDLLLTFYHKFGGLVWSLLGVPKGLVGEDFPGEKYLREAIEYSELRICDTNYIPMMIGGDLETNTNFFEASASKPKIVMDNILYLENQSDSLVYKNPDAARQEEREKIKAVEKEFL